MFQQQQNQEGAMEERIREREQIDKQHELQQRQLQIEEVVYGCVITPLQSILIHTCFGSLTVAP